ncbi:putative 5-formyltetrahydrofolate cyclo-ligase-family protein [Vibrio ichthyoenteri ATCC 700023]|uniref:5-formyltetrahydrofolate cyclo-ligase n=1 Tax=Vibrio ichthyoenteri ATCC 700023 TaxID=870968 RepID=F9RWF7_9VIBR|nr:5-formyltetrahydrofolate cyclo-ligase [Vibrio ichthyoenteri]EGU49214.1 putative 5-formyltetrahydrofolate cyclo-ligase-family protein [Vibrio ichthyoenteri ATCC 700023]
MLSRQQFRQQIRNIRQQLSAREQHDASIKLIEQFSRLPEISSAQHIALYLTADGEVDTKPLIDWLWHKGKQVYLPVIHPFSKGHLLFLHYQNDTPMVLNQYRIAEPKLNQLLIRPVNQLDIICTPLVGFDSTGHRLGMGGGYYDRTLAPWFKDRGGPKPIGLAHDCQHVERLPVEAWDVPLPKIVTPSKIWQWESHG